MQVSFKREKVDETGCGVKKLSNEYKKNNVNYVLTYMLDIVTKIF